MSRSARQGARGRNIVHGSETAGRLLVSVVPGPVRPVVPLSPSPNRLLFWQSGGRAPAETCTFSPRPTSPSRSAEAAIALACGRFRPNLLGIARGRGPFRRAPWRRAEGLAPTRVYDQGAAEESRGGCSSSSRARLPSARSSGGSPGPGMATFAPAHLDHMGVRFGGPTIPSWPPDGMLGELCAPLKIPGDRECAWGEDPAPLHPYVLRGARHPARRAGGAGSPEGSHGPPAPMERCRPRSRVKPISLRAGPPTRLDALDHLH